MDVYQIWCNLVPGTSDIEFCSAVDRYLGSLRDESRIAGHRITRRKLGLGPRELGEFHIAIEVEDLAQLERAFHVVSARSGPIEALHHAVNQHACDVTFALYRDFPDPQRQQGGELF